MARRRRRRSRLRGRLALPGNGGPARVRRALLAGNALDAIEAQEKAELAAREPGRPHFALRLSVTGMIVAGLFAVLLVRLWSIQVIQVQSYRKGAIQTTTRDVPISSPRGRILTRTGQVLAGDRSELVVTLATTVDTNTTPATRVASPIAEQNLVALIPGLSLTTMRSQLNNEQYGPYQKVPVAFGITAGAAATIAENPQDFPGASVVQQYVREYPQGSMAAQMLGYLGPIVCTGNHKPGSAACQSQLQHYLNQGYQPTDLIGSTGLEQQYEAALRGKDGVQQLTVSPGGTVLGTRSTTPPTAGDNVVLHLDSGLEKVLTTSLAHHIASLQSQGFNAKWGGGVVLNANNGAVLAIASYPTYNNNLWVGGISQANYNTLKNASGSPLNDYAIDGLQPPGSTFKVATATAALDSGLISPYSIINDPGYLVLPGGQILHDAPGDHPGNIDISQGLTISSDVFFYTLGERFWLNRAKYGNTPIQNMANRYGLGVNTGIDLPGAATGWVDSLKARQMLHKLAPSVYPPATWYLGDNVEMAFGQGETEITPIELAQAYATFANGGTRYAPQMAAALVSANGKVVHRIAPKVMGHVPLPPSTVSAMLAGFEGVTQNPQGTAYPDFIGFPFNKWLMAGKTGTATISTNHVLTPSAWFVGFGGPQNSSQRYVAVVLVDQGGYGTSGAAPVVRKIFNYLYSHGVPPLKLPAGG
jgi:penicillin-binding protein 2